MNLFGAISLGRSQSDTGFNQGDSTGFICYVQLALLLLDWILNTLTDNFLRDPLVVLVIFICQVLLLLIALIFYLMTSVNHAMKNGVHEKLFRHHQVTIALWVVYTSLLIWLNIWSLKRSWPTAGEHFSFTFSSDITATQDPLPDGIKVTEEGDLLFQSTTTDAYNGTFDLLLDPSNPTTEKPPTTSKLTTLLPTFASTIAASTTPLTKAVTISKADANPLASNNGNRSARSAQQDTSEEPGKDGWALPGTLFENLGAPLFSAHEEIMKINYTITSILSGNDTGNSTKSGKTPPKPFWSPGFIALYVIERSLSLFFYLAYILGTVQVANAEAMNTEESEDKGAASHRKVYQRSVIHNNNHNDFWGQRFGNDNPTLQNESDSNNFDETNDYFVRQLEEQDGDPFSNDQYEYQYRSDYAQSQQQRARFKAPKPSEPDTETEPSGTDMDKPVHSRRSKKKKRASGGEIGRGRSSNDSRNMENRKLSSAETVREVLEHWGRSTSGSKSTLDMAWGDDPKIYTTQSSSMIGMSTFKSGDSGIKSRQGQHGISVSMDTMGSGSTDELLRAEVFSKRS